MSEQLEQQNQFTKNSDFWIGEIRGNIARLNDAAAVVEIDISMPTRGADDITIGNKLEKIREFNIEFRRLYKNSKQIIEKQNINKGIINKINAWFKATSSQSGFSNVTLLKEGLKYSDELQDVLYNLGVKDIGIDEPEVFPYSYYKELYDGRS
jgi:hypothetical protein